MSRSIFMVNEFCISVAIVLIWNREPCERSQFAGSVVLEIFIPIPDAIRHGGPFDLLVTSGRLDAVGARKGSTAAPRARHLSLSWISPSRIRKHSITSRIGCKENNEIIITFTFTSRREYCIVWATGKEELFQCKQESGRGLAQAPFFPDWLPKAASALSIIFCVRRSLGRQASRLRTGLAVAWVRAVDGRVMPPLTGAGSNPVGHADKHSMSGGQVFDIEFRVRHGSAGLSRRWRNRLCTESAISLPYGISRL